MLAAVISPELLYDEEYREEISRASYYRERAEEAAVAKEQDLADCAYFALSWEDISDDAKRPYRTAVATACDVIAELTAA